MFRKFFPPAGIQELLKGLSKFPSDSNGGDGVSIQGEFAPTSSRSALPLNKSNATRIGWECTVSVSLQRVVVSEV